MIFQKSIGCAQETGVKPVSMQVFLKIHKSSRMESSLILHVGYVTAFYFIF
jgi:hypothetical protein